MMISEAVCGSPLYLSSPVWNEDRSPNITQPSTRKPSTIRQRQPTMIRFILLPNAQLTDGWPSETPELATAPRGRRPAVRLVGSSLDFPRVLAAVLPRASNHSLGFAFGHPSNAGPVFLAYFVIDLDNAWIQSIPPVLLAPGDPISD